MIEAGKEILGQMIMKLSGLGQPAYETYLRQECVSEKSTPFCLRNRRTSDWSWLDLVDTSAEDEYDRHKRGKGRHFATIDVVSLLC